MKSLTLISMIISIVGAIPSILYLINRIFYRPRMTLDIRIQELEGGSEFQVTLHEQTKQHRIMVNKALLYFEPAQWSLRSSDVKVERAFVEGQKHGLLPISIPFLTNLKAPRSVTSCNLMFSLKDPKVEIESRFLLVIQAQRLEGDLPWLIDMFPPRVTELKKEVILYCATSTPKAQS